MTVEEHSTTRLSHIVALAAIDDLALAVGHDCSFTLNRTIRLTNANGNGLSSGNLIVPFDVSYGFNSFANALTPDDVG